MKNKRILLTLSSVALLSNLFIGCGGKTQEFSVSFDCTNLVEQIETQKVKKGEKASKPNNPTSKDDKKKFVKWNLDGKEYNFDNPVEKDIILIPEFSDITFTVTFDTTGCKEKYESQIIKKGDKVNNPGNPTPEDESKRCYGWKNNNVVYDFNSSVESDLTLTPIIETKKFTVTFDTTGYEETFSSQEVTFGECAKNPGLVKPKDPLYNSYGWNLNGKYFDFNTPIKEDITLTPAITTCILNVSGTQKVDINDTTTITYTATKGGESISPIEWSTYNNVVNIDENGTITIPEDCKGGVDYIIAKATYQDQDYYGALPISVASFNKLDSAKLAKGIAAKSNDSITGKVIIPEIYFDNSKEIKITKIENEAFINCAGITDVISLGKYEEVPERTFMGCSTLEYVDLGGTIKEIGDEAFRNCVSLSKVVIPSSINKIGANAFTGDNLEDVTFENTDGWIYSNNNYPISIDLLSNKEYAGYLLSYFYNDSSWIRKVDVTQPLINAKEVTVELNDNYVTTATLFSNEHVNFYTNQHSIEISKDGVITPLSTGGTGYATVYAKSAKGETSCGVKIVTDKYFDLVNENELYLNSNAKEKCTSVSIPESYKVDASKTINIKNISKRGFYETRKLEYIYIPEYIEKIGDEAFGYDKDVIPETSLESVIFPVDSKCISIGDSCFRNCDKLTSVNLPRNLTDLGANAFEDCDNLTSVTIGDKITELKEETFKRCIKLKGLYIPSNVTKLGKNIFDSCSYLSIVYYGGTKEQFKNAINETLGYTMSLKVIHCIDGDYDISK